MSTDVRLGHTSIPSAQPRALASFYHDLLGLEISMQGSIPALGDFVFLSRTAEDELPLIALCSEPNSRHAALEVDSLATLKQLCAHARAEGITLSFALNHRCSLSLYFHDPEGNLLEVFWATGIKTDGPFSEPVSLEDLDRPEAELLELICTPA